MTTSGLTNKQVFSTSLKLTFLTMGSRAIGLITSMLTAAVFGTSGPYEGFLVATGIPTLLANVFLLGGFRLVLIPMFAEYQAREGEESAWRLASQIINAAVILVAIVAAVGGLMSPLLVRASAPWLRPDDQAIGADLSRVMFITLIFSVLHSIIVGLLNALNKFLVPAVFTIAVSVLNLVLLWVVRARFSVWTLALMNMASYGIPLLCVLFHYRKLFRKHYRFELKFDHPGIRRSLLMLLLVALIGVFNQVNSISDRFFASSLGTGAIAVLDYASRQIPLLLALFVTTIVQPSYVRLSQSIAKRDAQGTSEALQQGVRLTALSLFPVVALMAFLRVDVFTLLYGRGAFGKAQVFVVASVFLALVPAMLSWGLGQIVNHAYYANKDMWVPIVVTASMVALNILLDVIWVRSLGLIGLALASGIGGIIGLGILLAVLNSRMGGIPWKELGLAIGKLALCAGAAGAAAAATAHAVASHTQADGMVQTVLRLFAGCTVGGFVYLALVVRWRLREAEMAAQIITSRLRKVFFAPARQQAEAEG